MKETNYISQLTLELYYMDLVTDEEQKLVETALSTDKELVSRYETLKKWDQELRRFYSLETSAKKRFRDVSVPVAKARRYSKNKKILLSFGAIAILVCAFILSFVYLKERDSNDGTATASNSGTEIETTEDIAQDSTDEDEKEYYSEDKTETIASPMTIRNSEKDMPDLELRNPIATLPKQEMEIQTIEEVSTGQNTENLIIEQPPRPGSAIAPSEQQSNFVIPPGLTFIFDNMFANRRLNHVVIPDRIRSIGKNAFADNPLISVTIGAHVAIDDEAFPGNFAGAYKTYGETAGTYTRSDAYSDIWTKQ